MKEKTILVLSDTHCAHRAGLTHPSYQYKRDTDCSTRKKFGDMQRCQWNWFEKEIKSIGTIDVALFNGDLVEGDGKRNKGAELLATDENDQSDMAVKALGIIQSKEYHIVNGTWSHSTNVERQISKFFNCESLNQVWLDVNGLIIHARHKIGGASVPHGRSTAILKESLWNLINAEKGFDPMKANIIIRSHLHKAHDCRGVLPNQRLFITPSLQGLTDYGEKECHGGIDIGFLVFRIKNERVWTWEEHTMDIKFLAPEVIKV